MANLIFYFSYTYMKFKQLIEEFKKHKINFNEVRNSIIIKNYEVSFKIYGCYIILGRGLSDISRPSFTVPTKYVAIVNTDSISQVVEAVIEGIRIIQNPDKSLLVGVKNAIDSLRDCEKILGVKSVLYIVKLPDQTLSYRLCFDLVNPDIHLLFNIHTGRVIFTSRSPLIVPWDIGTIIYERSCSLGDLESVIFDEYYLIYNAKYYNRIIRTRTADGTRCSGNEICSEVIDFLDISKANKTYIETDDYYPLYKFHLVYSKPTDNPNDYCSILSPVKKDQPVRVCTNVLGVEVDYYITGLSDRDVLSVSKYIQSNIFNSHVKSQLYRLMNLSNINLDIPDKIESTVREIVVLVDSCNGTYTYKQTRTVLYLYEGLPSGIEFSLEVVMCEGTGEKYYNIISTMVSNMYKVPIEGNIVDICNYFVLSRYKQDCNQVLSDKLN